MEAHLDRKLLYLACGHHILELVVGAVWKLLFGDILGRITSCLQSLKMHKSQPIQVLKTENEWLLSIKHKVVTELKEMLSCNYSAAFLRNDYRESAKNTLIILGEIPPRSVQFLKPGAMHLACWMTNNIYAGKMYMFSKQMRFDDDMVVKLMR